MMNRAAVCGEKYSLCFCLWTNDVRRSQFKSQSVSSSAEVKTRTDLKFQTLCVQISLHPTKPEKVSCAHEELELMFICECLIGYFSKNLWL